MSDQEAEESDARLESQDAERESILAHGTPPDEPEIEEREIGALDDLTVVVGGDTQQPQAVEGLQEERERKRWRRAEGGRRWLQQAGPRVEPRQPVPRTRDHAKQLRGRIDEVEDLRHEEQEERLAEVAHNADDGEDHACEIAVGVAYEDLGRVPIVRPERRRDADEREQQVEREHVRVRCRVRVRHERREEERVVEDQQKGDDERLRDLDAVDPGQDVDAVGTEDGYGGHVGVVQPTLDVVVSRRWDSRSTQP